MELVLVGFEQDTDRVCCHSLVSTRTFLTDVVNLSLIMRDTNPRNRQCGQDILLLWSRLLSSPMRLLQNGPGLLARC